MKRNGYTLLEMSIALGLLILILGCFYAALRSLRDLEQTYWNETRAIVLLNNVLEQTHTNPPPRQDHINAILHQEFTRSGIPTNTGISAHSETNNHSLTLRIVTRRGTPLASMTIKVTP